jgi:virulence-associated protein VagC
MKVQNDLRLTTFLTEFHKSDNALIIVPEKSGPELNYLNQLVRSDFVDEENEDQKEVKKNCDEKIISWI